MKNLCQRAKVFVLLSETVTQTSQLPECWRQVTLNHEQTTRNFPKLFQFHSCKRTIKNTQTDTARVKIETARSQCLRCTSFYLRIQRETLPHQVTWWTASWLDTESTWRSGTSSLQDCLALLIRPRGIRPILRKRVSSTWQADWPLPEQK